MADRRFSRTDRLDEAVAEVVAAELERLDDPRLELVTITGADVSSDLSWANVWFTSHNGDGPALAALEAAAPRLRSAVGRQVRMKLTPKLIFKIDPAISEGERVDELLRRGVREDSLEES